jgi:RNA polymerase sigma-70 factor (ECF subfamily)
MTSTLDVAQALVVRAQDGDESALGELLTAVRRAVHRYTRARLSTYSGGAEAAEDVTQEVCLAVAEVLPRYTDRGAPFASLVYAIASNKVADAQRAYGRQPWHTVDQLPEQTSAPAEGPEARMLVEFDVAEASALVDQLPPKWATIVRLRAQGFTTAEVGDRVALSANNVRVTHHRALKRLRRLVA